MFSDWTPRNLAAHDENVEVYSNCDEVELFLNGKSLGAKPINADASPRNWKVSFAPGTLKAIARNKKKKASGFHLRTAGRPAKILLTADKKKLPFEWDDVSFVMAMVVDDQGLVVPSANDLISFKLTGPGVIAAVDNADNSSHEPFQASERRAFQGRCVAMLKSTAPGLGSNAVTLKCSKLRRAVPKNDFNNRETE